MFSREVKPLISGVFDGFNATIIAYGAKGCGKTHVIQVDFRLFLFCISHCFISSFTFSCLYYLLIEPFYCEGF